MTHLRQLVAVSIVSLAVLFALAAPTAAERTIAATSTDPTAEFGPGFTVLTTDHYRIVHDTSREFARYHARLFEAAFDAFTAYYSASGFQLTMPSEPLDVVLFQSRDRFREFAKTFGNLSGVGGFYSIGTNRIAFYDAFDDPEYREVRDVIRERERELTSLKRAVAAARGERVVLSSNGRQQEMSAQQAKAVVEQKAAELAAERKRLKGFYEERNLTTTIHECVHQLAFNLGVQNRRADNATWLAEGIATLFETVGYRDTGTSGLRNPQRARQFNSARAERRLIPLATLITDDEVFRDPDEARRLTAYGQSWALVQYLSEARPQVFYEYLRVIAADPPLADLHARKARRLELFRAAFGDDLAVFERGWHRFMDGVG